MTSTIWIGKTTGFRAVSQPDLPFPVRQEGFSEGFGLENGGAVQVSSAASAKVFEWAYGIRESADYSWLRQLRQGSLGDGLTHFADPETFDTNMCPAHWAEPGLIEQGWPSIYDTAPTYANTAANSYLQPRRSAVFTITQAANTAPTRQSSRLIIPIPPNMTLHLGASGSATGTGVVYVTGYNIAAGTTGGGALTLITPTSSTRMNATYAGSAYDYIAIDLRRTSGAASTITLTSLLAQMRLTTAPALTLTGNHAPGDGHTGLVFRGWDESYRVLGARSLRFSLHEVGAWLR